MNTGERIKKLRTEKGLTQEELGKLVGVRRAAVNKWETGLVENLKRSSIEKLSRIFMVSPSYLMGMEDIHIAAKKKETSMPREHGFSLMPIVGRISCGNGVLAFEEIEGYEPTPKEWLNGGEYFYLRAKGDSMIGARIFEGDLLLIRKQPEVENGEIAAILLGDEAILKRVFKNENQLILQSENPNYSPVLAPPAEAIIIGRLKKIIINM